MVHISGLGASFSKPFLALKPKAVKGELQCKTTLGEVKEGQKIRVFPVLVFCVDPPFKGKKP